jgi:hypothetical protein
MPHTPSSTWNPRREPATLLTRVPRWAVGSGQASVAPGCFQPLAGRSPGFLDDVVTEASHLPHAGWSMSDAGAKTQSKTESRSPLRRVLEGVWYFLCFLMLMHLGENQLSEGAAAVGPRMLMWLRQPSLFFEDVPAALSNAPDALAAAVTWPGAIIGWAFGLLLLAFSFLLVSRSSSSLSWLWPS